MQADSRVAGGRDHGINEDKNYRQKFFRHEWI
jgi:hypothetical protein